MKILLTGGTGFLGEYLLVELLARGHHVWAIYRDESRKLDTIRFLSSQGLPRCADSLQWFKGEILEADSQWENWCRQYPGLEDVDTLLHSAASTRLHLSESGEPLRTNIGSAGVLRQLVERRPMQVHIISTAYVCGFVGSRVVHEVNHPRGKFVNVYEESKWEAEQSWMNKATILRPSIIVGHSETGRCTSFGGWYIIFQALQFLGRLSDEFPEFDRHNLGLEVPAYADTTENIITVDYVAKAAVRLIENPVNHNKIFHLTNPDPPTHQWTLDMIHRRFDLGGIRFIGEGKEFTQPRNRAERMVWRQMQSIVSHFTNNPIFDRTNTDKALPDFQIPVITENIAGKLLDYAIEQDWGQSPR